jgi:hypothetical protein
MRRLLDALLAVVPAAVLLLLLPALLDAQSVPLDSGDKIRVVGRVTRGLPLIARVVEVRADTLVLSDGSTEPLVLLAGDLEAIEVRRASRVRETAVGLGVMAGLVGGTAAAVNLCRGHGPGCWYIEHDANGDGDMDDDDDSILPGVGTLTIGAIALVGGAVGAALTPARWKRVGGFAAAPVRMGLQGARRGLGVMVRIPFGGPCRDAAPAPQPTR